MINSLTGLIIYFKKAILIYEKSGAITDPALVCRNIL